MKEKAGGGRAGLERQRVRGGRQREGESEGDEGRREGGDAIARFQLPFVGLSADVTSCSLAWRVPERGTSPPAPSSATFQRSLVRHMQNREGDLRLDVRVAAREEGARLQRRKEKVVIATADDGASTCSAGPFNHPDRGSSNASEIKSGFLNISSSSTAPSTRLCSHHRPNPNTHLQPEVPARSPLHVEVAPWSQSPVLF
ncbi:unnamed protein product [Pleuronectes platessa]|uniref:Uncharacterized protein n=1 Tax=Pleuronectes platessa TaxID=8262 RepID=A0A9N7USH0_PLEPL|nr:unnamed protein product [Pleuronectes platessa]